MRVAWGPSGTIVLSFIMALSLPTILCGTWEVPCKSLVKELMDWHFIRA